MRAPAGAGRLARVWALLGRAAYTRRDGKGRIRGSAVQLVLDLAQVGFPLQPFLLGAFVP